MNQKIEHELSAIIIRRGSETEVQDVITEDEPSILGELLYLEATAERVLILNDSKEAGYRLLWDSEYDSENRVENANPTI